MNASQQLDLRPGDWVLVRSQQEILATLDDQGALDGLVFMPEMLAFCGQRLQVYKRAEKTCDTVTSSGQRRMDDTVHLATVRCDGSAHGGCQAECLLFWKEAWLKRADGNGSSLPVLGSAVATSSAPRDAAWLSGLTLREPSPEGDTCYRCQATELLNATCPLKWWQPKQYVRDVLVNQEPAVDVARGFLIAGFSKLLHKLTGKQFPDVRGKLKKTPSEDLDLEPGEWVEIKSKEEIIATLDTTGRNRGMTFEPEMIPYCGKRYRVLRRVHQLLDERTGRMKKMGSVGIILEGVICASYYRRPCPRANYLYWREIWLKRVESQQPAAAPESSGVVCVL